ncbi:hypothetical protein JCM18916_3123 [Cutibacterium acnes JCM 18916]|nr:hypothetical protein JCM18916_3123 [Cutibacterium acnes JCM 18916]
MAPARSVGTRATVGNHLDGAARQPHRQRPEGGLAEPSDDGSIEVITMPAGTSASYSAISRILSF